MFCPMQKRKGEKSPNDLYVSELSVRTPPPSLSHHHTGRRRPPSISSEERMLSLHVMIINSWQRSPTPPLQQRSAPCIEDAYHALEEPGSAGGAWRHLRNGIAL